MSCRWHCFCDVGATVCVLQRRFENSVRASCPCKECPCELGAPMDVGNGCGGECVCCTCCHRVGVHVSMCFVEAAILIQHMHIRVDMPACISGMCSSMSPVLSMRIVTLSGCSMHGSGNINVVVAPGGSWHVGEFLDASSQEGVNRSSDARCWI